jgi:hypothetical protein
MKGCHSWVEIGEDLWTCRHCGLVRARARRPPRDGRGGKRGVVEYEEYSTPAGELVGQGWQVPPCREGYR